MAKKTKAKKIKTKSQKPKTINLSPPLTEEALKSLRAGDKILISGKIYCARDSAHRLFADHPPFDPKGAILYYASPTPTRKNSIIGSIGPTTASRMDPFTPGLLKLGIKATIGKGSRGSYVKEALKRYKAVYLVVPGGTAAALSRHVKKSTVIAYPELGPEAVLEIDVVNFPAIVAIDYKGGDLYEEGKKKYHVKS